LIAEVEKVALAAWRVLGCRDAGRLDVRCDKKGRPHFMEVNPLAGLHPTHSDLPIICSLAGMSFDELLTRILKSAALRVRPSTLHPA
jgi:D-alanine-D-alanine ligase